MRSCFPNCSVSKLSTDGSKQKRPLPAWASLLLPVHGTRVRWMAVSHARHPRILLCSTPAVPSFSLILLRGLLVSLCRHSAIPVLEGFLFPHGAALSRRLPAVT